MDNNKKSRCRKILFGCISVSILLHVCMLMLLHGHLLWMYSPYNNLFLSNDVLKEKLNIEQYEKIAKEEVVNLFFHEGKTKVLKKGDGFAKRKLQKEGVEAVNLPLKSIGSVNPPPTQNFSTDELLSKIKEEKIVYDIDDVPLLPTHAMHHQPYNETESINKLKDIAKHLPSCMWEDSGLGVNKVIEEEAITNINQELISVKKVPITMKYDDFVLQPNCNDKELLSQLYMQQHKQYLTREMNTSYFISSELPQFPNLNKLKTVSFSDDFDLDVTYDYIKEDEGYVFAVTLIPKLGNKFKKIPQNYHFFVDCSNTIQKDRLTKTRHALVSSLQFLRKSDKFNVYCFDNKMDVLFDQPSYLSKETLSDTKRFLLDMKLGSFFKSTNFSQPFYSLFRNNINDKELHTIIFISNGEELHKSKNYRMLHKWTESNKGMFSLFTVGVDSDVNATLLELFAKKNRGGLVTATTPAAIKRQLQGLIKSIKHPIAKDMVPTIYGVKDTQITFYPSEHQMSHLYAHQPYVIFGKTDKLDDFVLFLQGKNNNGWFHVKKEISFNNASKGGVALAKQWALQKSFLCYNRFFFDNNPNHLIDAQIILQPFAIKPIFQ
jgi:hypothetical protein